MTLIGNGRIIKEQIAGFLYPQLGLIFGRGHRILFHKDPIQLACRDSDILCHVINGTAYRVVCLHKRNCLFQVYAPLALVLLMRRGGN